MIDIIILTLLLVLWVLNNNNKDLHENDHLKVSAVLEKKKLKKLSSILL